MVGSGPTGCCDGGPCGDPCCEPSCGGVCGWFTRHGWGRRHECWDACCDGCCAPRPRFWASAEYLLWTVKDAPAPPLATLNRTGGLPVLGTPGTTVLIGGGDEGFNLRSGGRFTLGFGLPCLCDTGLEATYFFLADRTHGVGGQSTGIPSIGRPFTDVGPKLSGFPGNQNAQLVAFDGLVAGRVNVDTRNELWGVESNLRHQICCGCNYHVDVLGG